MMNLTMLTPEREIFSGTIQSIKVPGAGGQFQILQNHAPIVSALESGTIAVVAASGESLYFDGESGSLKTVDQPGKQLSFQISGGFIEVLQNNVTVLVQGMR